MADLNGDLIELESARGFHQTVVSLVEAIEGAGMTLFASIDHAEAARGVGLSMPPTTVLIYGNPRGGTLIMLAAPLAALDLPLRVLIREMPDGRTRVTFRRSDVFLRRAGVPKELAERLLPAQHLLSTALGSEPS